MGRIATRMAGILEKHQAAVGPASGTFLGGHSRSDAPLTAFIDRIQVAYHLERNDRVTPAKKGRPRAQPLLERRQHGYFARQWNHVNWISARSTSVRPAAAYRCGSCTS
ncbi:hypothetical protein AN403_5965 [Pseudomonas fluorescens]|uniref:Uncharacterized protein n=1 Tax=Pseudomonas fluorescens TaxID=294 RepID=A0A0P8X7A8_PSEFL|nr:hypothetical protein AN403_5965 [Pseudomonas fluorescens]